ncbi:MAG: universal stress protein [Candidatus Sulfotelmatobacter sp.]
MSTLSQIHHPETQVQFKQIVIATDFSPSSRCALTYALSLAQRYGSTLSVVHAMAREPREPIPLERLPRELNVPLLDAERQMHQLAENARLDIVNHHLIIRQGPVWDVLSSIMEREDVDLLVLGTRGRGGLKKLALGSIAEQVLRLAPCPVLTIGPHVPPPASGPIQFRGILFPTDFGRAADAAFPYALSIAEEHQARFILLHMLPPMPLTDVSPGAYCPSPYAAEQFVKWQHSMREESRIKLMKLLPSSTKLAVEPEYISSTDFLPEGILETAAIRRIDLIVMGANRASSPRVSAHIPWALTHEVICRASCPVLTCMA